MATKILLKKSVTSGAAPLTGDIDTGEIAINLADRKIYTKDNGGAVVTLGSAYVDTTAPANPAEGDLWYDSTNNLLKAHNGSAFVSAGYQTLGALEDTTLTSLASGEILKYNGSAWVNNTLAEADIQAASATVADARGAISVTDAGGDGSASYDSATGVITYTGPSAAEVQAHITAGEGIDIAAGVISGEDATDANKGIASFSADEFTVTSGAVALKVDGIDGTHVDFGTGTNQVNTDLLTEGSTNLYHTSERVDDRVAALIVGGTNLTATYDDTANTLTLDATAAGGYDLSSNDTDDLSEGSTNLYHTTARARAAVSVTDAGGDGSAAYNSTTGVITYTGPSAAETQAHITAGTGVAVASGVVSIGQAVETSSNVTFAKVTTSLIEGGSTITIDPAGLGDNTGTVVIAGDLTVNGTTTTVNSNEVNIGDAVILLNSDEAGTPSADSGFEVERGTATNVAFKWIEADDSWDMQSFPLQNVILDGGTY